MGRPKVIEVDYYVLIEKIRLAANAGCLFERMDKEKWKAYVTQNNIRETSLEAFGKVKFLLGKPKLIGIAMNSEWDGCYAYSTEDEAALKFVPAD